MKDLKMIANPTITVATRHVAEAQQTSEACANALATAKKHQDKISSRVNELAEQRAGVVARRQTGDTQESDGSTLALIAADSEGLSALAVEAERIVGAALDRVNAARTLLLAAEAGLRRAQDHAEQDALLVHASKLDVLMLQTVCKLNDVSKRLGDQGTPKWGPSQGLALELRKLQALRREL
jgi:hypothetical protein